MDVLFFHGLESGPFGSKYRALVNAGLPVRAPDYRGLNLAARVTYAADLIEHTRPRVLVGSSYGGATAVRAVERLGRRVPPGLRVVLCAPAVYMDEEPCGTVVWPAGVGAVSIHGRQDDVVPFAWSERFAQESQARVVAVQDGHRLANSIDVIVREAEAAFRAEIFAWEGRLR
jgi:pimeloyl-ACP methyl ester carboxylesterase